MRSQALAQNTVFGQVVKLIPRTQFESFVNKHEGDHGVRSLDCWTWFGALLFGQLTGHDSIRSIERVFAKNDSKIKKLGFNAVCKSTLADANKSRPLEILENTFSYLLRKAQQLAPKNGFRFNGHISVLDSSSISLSLKLMPWSQQTRTVGGVKLHAAIDLAGDLPEVIVLEPARIQDLRVARKEFKFKKGTTVIFDKGYSDFEWFRDLNDAGVFFDTRLKTSIKFKVAKSRVTDRTRGHICDQEIYFNGPVAKRKMRSKTKLRRISYRDPDTGKKLIFLTNRFDLATQTICDLYKARWKVELFFKTLKQNLKIKKFLGNSFHAVKAQIWVALIAYLMVQIWRFMLKTRISIPDAMAVIGTLILLKEPLKRLLGPMPRKTRHPPERQLMLPI
jgi:hypothetical protein